MSSETKASESSLKEMERQAAERAMEKVRSMRWDISTAVIAYAFLGALVLMRLDGVAIEIIAAVAVVGLSLIWFAGWRRGKQMFSRFFYEELRNISEYSGARKAETSVPSPLTPKETEIINYIANGSTNKEIAYKLHIGEQTIKNHVSTILSKLDASDRTQAVVMAMRYGWISFPDREPSELDKDE